MSTLGHSKQKQSASLYKKYAKSSEASWIDPMSKLKPSDLSKSSVDVAIDDYPMIIEFNNILDNTAQVHSTVDIDQPIFQPSPKVLVFEDYAPFATHEKKLYFRNNDSVARRIKVLQPESLFFELSAPKTANGEPLKQSKIAAGMEIYYIIRFKPQEVRDYALELVCSTEREKFIVPIRAVGMHPKMTFPDEINFGTCPVKSTTRKTLLVQNLGSSVARFTMRSLSNYFTCPTEEMVVEASGSQMIEMYFTPPSANITEAEIEVEFTKGVKCYIAVSGSGKNVDVSLSTPSVTLDSSYISLSSQKTMRIKNTSDVPIKFMWKSFSNENEEESERSRLLAEINRMESIEQAALSDRIRSGYYGSLIFDDIDDDRDDDDAIPLEARADEATLVRKYRNLRTALGNDPMQFVDDIFEVTPIDGHVWAHSEIEITITFRPDTAAKFTCLAYLDISGRQDRLPLHLSGQGIGPHAALSFDVLDIGDVFVNDEQFYSVSIVNKGDIPAQWTFMSSLTRFGNKFDFTPKEGYLSAGQTQAIKIKFDSDVLGEFAESFRFALQGNDDMLVCQIKGHVIGPTFHFDRQKIDFGTVSFDYLHSTVLRMVNTSKIPMVYNLRIPQDGTYLKKEFDIQPSEGTLPAGQGVDINIDFIPGTVKLYEYSLTVDVLGVGDMLLSVPVSAECKVVPLRLVSKDVEFGDCFVRYPYERYLELMNPTDVLHIKFEMLPQLLYTCSLGSYEAEPAVGVIEPGDKMRVKIRLIASRLGSFKIPIMIAIAGSQEPPMQAMIDCNCIGPRVLLDSTDLKWGNIECLKDSTNSLKITNDSLIPASMKIFLKLARSKFELSTQQLDLEPMESFDLQITANLDDSVVTKDELHVLVDEGDSLMVPLSAKGIGTTMACSHDMQVLDLGVQLTSTVFEKRVILENKGRRPQQLRWTNITVKEENIKRAKKAVKAGKVEGQKLPKHLAPISALYTVSPEEITLRPRTATTFVFKGMSPIPGNFSEVMILESKVGKERMMREIIRTEVRCNVVNPLLEFSKSRVDFVYAWQKDVMAAIQRTDVVLRNTSAISLTFVLKVEVPFNLNSFEHTLEPGESVPIEIEFDPLYRDDMLTHMVDKLLSITYRGHPQKDSIPLTADISFPNLKFDLSTINFGSVLNDINKTIRVKATNWSKVIVTYEWSLLDDQQQMQSRSSKASTKSRKASAAAILPPGQVFDILPVRSVLEPGESEDIEFTMYGVANCKFLGSALCKVDGGPDYKLPLSGEASTVSFKIERCSIDFGKVMYSDRKDEELVIVNDGRVAFNYEIVPVNASFADIIEILPPTGKVAAGESFVVTLRIRPALPAPIAEMLTVSIAHFDPVTITCYCQGFVPTAVVGLPRHLKVGPLGEVHGAISSLWESFVSQASSNIVAPDSRLLPPSEDSLPPPASATTAVPPMFVPSAPLMLGSGEESHHHGRTVKAPSQMVLEVEMQRMALCHHLAVKIDGLGAEVAKDNLAPSTSLQSLINKYVDVKSIVAANYICDFGNVIVGQQKKKVFQVTNASFAGQLSWVFDKKHLSGSGFSVDPEKVQKLPEQASVEFAVRYAARGAKLGRKTCILPLETKGAPTLNILLSVNVTMPEIEMSMEEIDMGRVLIGRSRQVFIRMHNTSPVSAPWRLKTVPGKEEGKITITPSDGNIRAGKKIVVCIEFMPAEPREYSLETLLKIESNNKSKLLKVFGEGVGTPVKFDSPFLELGPVLPFSDGEEKEVVISNENETAVEIFSLEFDNVFKDEETVFSGIDIYDEAGVLRTDPRNAGDPLPAAAKAEYDRIAAATAAALSDQPEDDVSVASFVPYTPTLRKKPAPRDTDMHQDILVIGPPASGVTSIANHLSKKLQLVSKTVDELVDDVASCDGEIGFLVRRCLGRLGNTEGAALAAKEKELLGIAEKSKAEAEDAYKKANKKAKVVPEEVYRTAEREAYEKFLGDNVFNASTFAKALQFRLSWDDVGYGLIVDNIISSLVSEETIMKGFEIALPKLVVANVLINGGEEAYAHRVEALYNAKVAEIHKLSVSIAAEKKVLQKLMKTSSRGRSTAGGTKRSDDYEGDEIPVVLPSGEESWYNSATSLINELDILEVRALEDKQKTLYYRQLLYQKFQQRIAAEDAVAKYLTIWSPITGLKLVPDAPATPSAAAADASDSAALGEGTPAADGAPAAAEEAALVATEAAEAAEDAVAGDAAVKQKRRALYSDYAEKILPAVAATFQIIPTEPTEEGEAAAAAAESEEGEKAAEAAAVEMVEPNIIDITLDGDEPEDVVFSTILALLPSPKTPPPDKDAVPPSCMYQVNRKPLPRAERKPVRNFEIIRVDEPAVEGDEPPAPVDPAHLFRWVIAPFSSAKIKIRFRSKKQGKFDTNLRFEMMGTQQVFVLHCSGHCEIPSINTDTRNVFMKRMRMLTPGAPDPLKRFVIAENFYSFGPILLCKKPEWKALLDRPLESLSEEEAVNKQLVQTNVDILRISNNGRYKCQVDFGFEKQQTTPETTIFSVEPNILELEEGETKDIKVWAFPNAVKDFDNTLVMCVSNNPTPIRYDLKCWGVLPTVDIDGPWNEGLAAAEAAVAACTDKKLIKDLEAKLATLKESLTLDFDRMLIGKTEQRTFNLTNTSLLPVAWEIDLGDFTDSKNMFISPASGVILSGGTVTVALSFTSPEPLMLTGKFSLKYSDAEGGLLVPARFTERSFRAVAEAYSIQAVSLTATGEEDGGSEVDFGLMRVGDYAIQTLKMGNKGKYKIGFKFTIMKPALAALIKIEPEEGTIESGAAPAEIKLTYCASAGELLLKNNKDIKVLISEPVTGEVVETFPLYVSAQSKYCRFRMQPAKGVTFGAIRFDSEPKTKRIELRNEGSFEFTYVVCPAITEHDELDLLESSFFSAYAYGVPAATRNSELGETYLERAKAAGGAGAAAAKGKDTKAPAGKGKPTTPAAGATRGANNPLVQDPDGLVQPTIADTPLVVGSFTVFPRMGVVQPGQSIGIDAKFDPSGCDTVREKLRICISGVSPSDGPSQLLRAFDLSAESCIPAIVVNDPISIFEEQEVVSSFAETIGSKGEGSGKLESLPVGKVVYVESDKMLAFGPVMCGNATSRGVVERIKITNPTKIDTKVNFRVVTSEMANQLLASDAGNAAAAAAAAKGKEKAPPAKGKGAPAEEVIEQLPFTVFPDTFEIPPHEHRFVSVTFNPTEIKSYRAVFVATVDMEGSSTTAARKPSTGGKVLSFDLGGSGTLPCIAIESPVERAADGSLSIAFGRVHINRSAKRKFVLRNDGVMPVTCLFNATGDDDILFPNKGSSLTLQPGSKADLFVTFVPTKVYDTGDRKAQIKISVLHNQFDSYVINLLGTAYACDAMVEALYDDLPDADQEDSGGDTASRNPDEVIFEPINLAEGAGSSTKTIMLKSRADHPLKFEMVGEGALAGLVTFSPQVGHLAPKGSREVTVTLKASEPVKVTDSAARCSLTRISYKEEPAAAGGAASASEEESESEAAETKKLWGLWDDSMKSIRPASEQDLAKIAAYEAALKEYTAKVEAESKKGKKAKPVGSPPEKCMLQLAPPSDDGSQMIIETVGEPPNESIAGVEVQQVSFTMAAVADVVKYNCAGAGENVLLKPTFMFQTTVHRFAFANECNIPLPVRWTFENIKRRGTVSTRAGTARSLQSRSSSERDTGVEIPCPFSIDPEECEVAPKSSKEFTLRFNPQECDDFVYLLKGETLSTIVQEAEKDGTMAPVSNVIRMVLRATAKRPICHFDIKETPDYFTRRPPNMKNEIGVNSPIETGDIKVVEVESTGLRTRNTFRFYVTNPTNDNYEFGWETCGEPSPAWRCVQSSGMLFSGKRVEMVFEYLPEETAPAESFYKFKLHGAGLEQLFLFAGKVLEPKVLFSTAKLDFHSVMLGGEGGSETIFIENQEHLPFNFAFDKGSMLQLQGTTGPIVDIEPKSGNVLPHGRCPVTFTFHPQEEVTYNFNVQCEIKRKPNKLSINVKGEGYAVHPLMQLETSEEQAALRGGERFMTLRPAPFVNYADFGAVQVLDTVAKKLTVTNNGKYNFDYVWDTESMGSMITLSGGKMGGTLQKAGETVYTITFAPQREEGLAGSMLSFTVAGKYVYTIIPRGSGVKPALRFSFMHHDFGPCFITSPGGSTVVEDVMLRLVNHDPSNNIAVECIFQKTRALWVECPPTVLEPGGVLDVPIRFAPRDVKDYQFVVPFVVNGTGKVPVSIIGSGISARVELVSTSQRRTNFGVINVGSEARKTVALVNKSKKAVEVQLIDDGQFGGGALAERCVTFFPQSSFVIAPRETANVAIVFSPNKRIPLFAEDLLINFAGLSRKLLNVSGKAQGVEVNLDTDSLPFGIVVMDSQKIKKLTLENTGDLPITFRWMESTFGPHFSITPTSGKIVQGSEMTFDVIFRPRFVDEDIRQDNILLSIPGLSPLQLTCTGSSILQPSDSIQTLQFLSQARKAAVKTVKITNPTDKDWYLAPSLQGVDWTTPHEFKVPAKAAADMVITYFPLTMRPAPVTEPGPGETDTAHTGQLFLSLPDGTAQLYRLRGYAGEPECSEELAVTTPAKKPAIILVKLNNWLPVTQKFSVSYEFTERSSPAAFIVVANAVEVSSNGSKEFPVRFMSSVEGVAKGTVTFTNQATGEFMFYRFTATTTAAEVLETITMDSPVRQTARYIITVENPLPPNVPVNMVTAGPTNDWWSCDSKFIKINELAPLSGNSEGTFEVEYRPLLPLAHPSQHVISITTRELGVFKYNLMLTATPPTLRQSLRFSVPLGSMQAETFVFKAFNSTKCEYNCSLKRTDVFAVQKSVVVEPVAGGWDGADIRVDISFEPTDMGEVRDVLTVTSPEGGEYVCELIANCVAPLPQGPFNLISDGKELGIPFRNCFSAASTWTFSVDSTAFRLVAPSTTVQPKSQGTCGVVFDPKEEHMGAAGGVVSAKLFIKCSAMPEVPPWVFYLRGKIDLAAMQGDGKGKKK